MPNKHLCFIFFLVSTFVIVASRNLGKHIITATLSKRTKASNKIQQSGWFDTSSMNIRRFEPVSCLLKNGKVLVIGGVVDNAGLRSIELNDSAILDSTELYDPSSGKWTMANNMHYPRTDHAVSVLLNGNVLVTGGVANGEPVIDTAELYNSSTGTWINIDNMHDGRSSHTSSVLPNGKVLVTGGLFGASISKTTEIYDPSTGNWTYTDSMHYQRYGHAASVLPNGKVLVTGGFTDYTNVTFTSTTELYDPSTGTWTLKANMTQTRIFHTATVLTNGKMLVTGANGIGLPSTAELYDPSTDTWTMAGRLQPGRLGHTASLLRNGKVLITGGIVMPFKGINSSELYDPSTGTWTTADNMNFARFQHTATVLTNGNVLVTGGWTGDYPFIITDTAELYNASTEAFIYIDNMKKY